jgi:hypothetical protein
MRNKRLSANAKIADRYEKNLAVSESDTGNSLLIFENGTEKVHVLNITGRIIWHSLSASATVTTIAKALQAWFNGLDDATAARAIEQFLERLGATGLLVAPGRGGFSVGKEVSIKQNKRDVAFEEPEINTYSKDWLKKTHRLAFDSVLFSDTWSPATPNP